MIKMNHQNMMQQYFDPQQQQTSMNGFPGSTAFQPNQQISSSFNGPTSVSNPYITSAGYHQQNGVSRYSTGTENENYDNIQSAANSQAQAQMFPNYIDPRMSGFDPRSRPNFDPMSTGIDGFGSNMNFPGKMRMNDSMTAIFNNPAALTAFQQRQQMGMYGREGEYMGPNNPFGGGFNHQAANYIQQQRLAAFQRQIQETNHSMQNANQFPPTTSSANQSPTPVSSNDTSTKPTNSTDSNANSNRSTPPIKPQQGFPQSTTQQAGKSSNQLTTQGGSVSSDIKSQQNDSRPSSRSNTPIKANTPNPNSQSSNELPIMNKFASSNNTGSGSSQKTPFDQQNNTDPQRNAAMLAAAAVRAAAAASSRAKAGIAPPGTNIPNYPYPHGFPMNPEMMQQSPYLNQNIQSPELGVISPNKDGIMSLNQGRTVPRNSAPPPPYSPSPFSNDSNHSGSNSGLIKVSTNIPPNIQKASAPNKSESRVEEQPPLDNKENCNTDPKIKQEQDGQNCDKSQQQHQVPPCSNANMLSISHTVSSTPNSSSPVASPFRDDLDIDNLSPSWPNTPLSPNTQKKLKSKTSPKQYDQLSKVYEVIVDEEKRNFFDRYLAFMSVNGTPVTKLPVIGKKTLDLYTLFRSVCERGGIQQVMEKRLFREILSSLGLPCENVTLSYMVKEQYMTYLHAYELKAKEALLKKWGEKTSTIANPSISNTNTTTSISSVPTIALNDSFQPDAQANATVQNIPHSLENANSQTVCSSTPSSCTINTSTPSNTVVTGNQYKPRMSYSNIPNHKNPAISNFNQQNMNNFGPGGQDIPPGYPGFTGYQNPMYQRPPGMQSFNAMRPGMVNDQMAPGWPRGFSPRQGPPELYPEGLQRMPWNQSSPQRHPVSAFATPNYSNNKVKGKMPQISCDPLEQLKYNAQQQIKMQQYHQQQQQQQQQPPQPQQQLQSQLQKHSKHSILQHSQQFNQLPTPQQSSSKRFVSPDAKPLKGRIPPSHDVRHQLTPTHHLKREFTFPPESVEATKPLTKKRKKLTSKDLGPVEAWRIMMSLKSGLVAECTWAIDTLNILLADNNTITYFHLKQLPGLLDTLMDHYRRCMVSMFKELKISEINLFPSPETDDESKTVDQKLLDLWVGVCKNAKTSYTSNIASTAIASSIKENLKSGKEFWQDGGGDNTEHIEISFPNKDIHLKSFPKGIRFVTKDDEGKQRDTGENDKDRTIPKSTLLQTVERNKANEEISLQADISDPEPKNCKMSISQQPVGCMQIIDHLLKECEKDEVEGGTKQHPMITRLIKDFEFMIPCDKKYIDDSKEFIEYLNRRLLRENRGNVESEHCVVRQSTPFVGIPDCELSLLQRCVAMSNVFRSLSFIQGNDTELANHAGLLSICAFVLLHKHEHAITDHSQFKLGFDERIVPNSAFPDDFSDTWWQSLFSIRENTIVLLANIAGHLNLTQLRKDIRDPLITGLFHWIVCRSSQALDPMPTAPGSHALSAQRLCIETLAKLTINPHNVSYVTSSPIDSVLEEVGDVLVKHMARKSLVPNREFAIILVDNLAHSERFSKVLATRKSAIRNICTFLYDAEKNTSNYLSSGGRVQPGLNAEEICGTSISLLRRAVNILLSVAKLPCNRSMLAPYTEEFLTLSTSQMIDTSVLALLAAVLFELSE